MAKLDTGAEYLPSLPEEFPASVLTEIERHYWTTFTAEQRELVSRAGYSLVDAIQRDASRPNYPKVRDRLEKLIKCLASARDATELREQLHEMLHTDGVGEALGSLLVFPAACQQPIGTLSPDAFERRRADLFAAANALLVLLRANYDDVRGPEPHAYIDLFITRLAEVYVPGRVTAGYNHALGAQDSPFIRFAHAVADQALRCFGLKGLDSVTSQRARSSLRARALGRRVARISAKADKPSK